MATRPEDIFCAYSQPGLVINDTSVWIRFDHEFVRLMDEKAVSKTILAKELGISWSKLNSFASRNGAPKWMTPDVLLRMNYVGFDLNYVLLGQISPPPLQQDEAKLLDNYRNSSEENKKVLRKVGAALEKQIEDGNASVA